MTAEESILNRDRLPAMVAELLKREPPSGGWLGPEFEPGLVSVIIPAYNRADLIGETLASLLAQTYDKVEVVVADDGSTDSTQEVLAGWRERFRAERGWELSALRQPNRGTNAARNLAARECRGEYLNFLDSDDLMPADRLAAQVRVLRAGGLDLVHGPWVRFYPERTGLFVGDERRFECPDPDYLRAWLRGFLIVWTCLMTRRFADRVGPFDDRLVGGNVDSEYMVRLLLQQPRMEYCPTGPIFQRRHLGSVGFNRSHRAYANVIYWLTRLERRLEEEGKLDAYRKGLARKFRSHAVEAYRDGARDLGDYCADRSSGLDPEYRPRGPLLGRVPFYLGSPRLGLRLQGWGKRLGRWCWRLARALGGRPSLEPVTRVAQLPLRSGGEA